MQIDGKCVLYGKTDDPTSDDSALSYKLDNEGACNYIMGIAVILCIIYSAGELIRVLAKGIIFVKLVVGLKIHDNLKSKMEHLFSFV